MKISAPSKLCFIISLVLFILALLAFFGVVAILAANAFWLAVASWVVLAVGSLITGF